MTRTASFKTPEPVATEDEPCPHCGLKRSEAVKARDYESEMKQQRFEKAVNDAEMADDVVMWKDAVRRLRSHFPGSLKDGVVVSGRFHRTLVNYYEAEFGPRNSDSDTLKIVGIPIRCNDGK